MSTDHIATLGTEKFSQRALKWGNSVSIFSVKFQCRLLGEYWTKSQQLKGALQWIEAKAAHMAK
jgi:hypothetical protein